METKMETKPRNGNGIEVGIAVRCSGTDMRTSVETVSTLARRRER